jgi:hypothetical protein
VIPNIGWGQQSDSLSALWKKAKVSGQVRHYWMASVNKGELKDFAAAAIGGKIGLTTGTYRGFSLGVKVYTSYNLGITDLSVPDPTTNRLSRYELGLFDVADPNNRFIFLLGEAYLQYARRGHRVKVGRMLLKTPMLNPQDGRMIPTLEQGIWYTNTGWANWELTAGYIQAIAPRSTARWYKTQNSIGWYPQGRNTFGEAGLYQGNTSSPGLFIQGVSFQPNTAFRARVWNYAFANVFNALYAFQKRERQEGFADSWSVLLQTSYTGFDRNRLTVGYGFYRNTDVLDSSTNKYGIPSFHQLNLDWFYDFKGDLDRLGAELLITYKIAEGNTYDDPRFVMNKVDMAIFNLIFNYDF